MCSFSNMLSWVSWRTTSWASNLDSVLLSLFNAAIVVSVKAESFYG